MLPSRINEEKSVDQCGWSGVWVELTDSCNKHGPWNTTEESKNVWINPLLWNNKQYTHITVIMHLFSLTFLNSLSVHVMTNNKININLYYGIRMRLNRKKFSEMADSLNNDWYKSYFLPKVWSPVKSFGNFRYSERDVEFHRSPGNLHNVKQLSWNKLQANGTFSNDL